MKMIDFEQKEEVKVQGSEIIKIEDKKNYKAQSKTLKFDIDCTKIITSTMNKVSILNLNLHKKYLIIDQEEEFPQPVFKSTQIKKINPPQQTLKRLIKKGLTSYASPSSRPKSGFKYIAERDNTHMRHSQDSSKGIQIGSISKNQKSQSIFTCSRGHGTSINSNHRMLTEDKQNGFMNTRYMINNTIKAGDCDWILPSGSHMFRDFRNISQQSFSRLNVENERRNFKLGLVHKVKYDTLWKKYPIPSKSKEKSKPSQCQPHRQNIL